MEGGKGGEEGLKRGDGREGEEGGRGGEEGLRRGDGVEEGLQEKTEGTEEAKDRKAEEEMVGRK